MESKELRPVSVSNFIRRVQNGQGIKIWQVLDCLVCLAIVFHAIGCKTQRGTGSVGDVFAAYDQALKQAVNARWHGILQNELQTATPSGKVVVEFKLHHTGHISDLTVLETTAPPALVAACRRAISDSAPFGRWAREMRLACGTDERKVRFAFICNPNVLAEPQ